MWVLQMTLCYRDKTYCASPSCQNECERKITERERIEAKRLEMPIMWAYFCGEPEEKKDDTKN